MLTSGDAGWGVRGATLGVWLLAAGSAAYWALQFGAPPHRAAPVAASTRGPASADPGAIARLLGGVSGPVAGPAAPSLASRFALVGVAAERSGQGAALIAVDGKPARPYRVGSFVDEGLVLQAVRGHQAMLGAKGGPAMVTLELPLPAPLPGVTRPPFAAVVTAPPMAITPAAPAGPANLPVPGTPPAMPGAASHD